MAARLKSGTGNEISKQAKFRAHPALTLAEGHQANHVLLYLFPVNIQEKAYKTV